MRFKRLDLNLLLALDILLDERSVTQAARRLNLSQSATSGVMARLREYFEDELLVPVGRTMLLTPLAESLAGPVREVLLQIQSTIETKPGFDALTSTRHFRVICSDFVGSVIMAGVARALAEQAPDITLELILPNDVMHQNIERAEIDLLILPEQFLNGDHPRATLFSDTYACAVWSGNNSVGAEMSLEHYLGARHVTTNFGARRSPTYEEIYLKSIGRTRRIDVTTSTFNTLPQYVIGTRRIATMHRRLAELFASYYPLRVLDCPIDIPPITQNMTWPKSMDSDLSHRFLRQLVLDAASTSPLQLS